MFTKIKAFLQESKQELHRVDWPTRQETIKLTSVVIFMSLLVALYLGVLDFGFAKLLNLIIS